MFNSLEWAWHAKNFFVDTYVRLRDLFLPVPSGMPVPLLKPVEKSGPDYPQSVIELDRFYRQYRARITRTMIRNAAAHSTAFRGIYRGYRYSSNAEYIVEFFYEWGTVLILFFPSDIEFHAVRMRIMGLNEFRQEECREDIWKFYERLDDELFAVPTKVEPPSVSA